jgi:DNA repair protein RecO (recombination protein O)
MVELLSKTITEPESNADLYEFIENSFLHVEQSKEADLANYPIEFTFALASQLGFEVQNAYKENQNYFDLQNGNFCSQQELASTYFLQDADAALLSQIIYSEPIATNLNQSKRNELLRYAIQYIQLHIPHVSDLKSVAVLHSMLS